MFFYLAFGPLYRFPKSSQEESLGYGYSLDKQNFCKEIITKDPCKGVKDAEKCKKSVENINICMESVDI